MKAYWGSRGTAPCIVWPRNKVEVSDVTGKRPKLLTDCITFNERSLCLIVLEYGGGGRERVSVCMVPLELPKQYKSSDSLSTCVTSGTWQQSCVLDLDQPRRNWSFWPLLSGKTERSRGRCIHRRKKQLNTLFYFLRASFSPFRQITRLGTHLLSRKLFNMAFASLVPM
jgi:hypothetical protein